jgi:hypothetical protein
VASEGFLALRRSAFGPKFQKDGRALGLRVPQCLAGGLVAGLHMLQLVLGYFLMLLAMTYHIPLFVAVVFGVGLGHWLCNSGCGPVSWGAPLCKLLAAALGPPACGRAGGCGGKRLR